MGEANQLVSPARFMTNTGAATSPSPSPASHTGLRWPPVVLPPRGLLELELQPAHTTHATATRTQARLVPPMIG